MRRGSEEEPGRTSEEASAGNRRGYRQIRVPGYAWCRTSGELTSENAGLHCPGDG